MIALKRGFQSIISCRTCQMMKYSSINTNYEGLTLKPKFTIEEQAKILEILNKSNTEQLSRFDVSQGRIKNLENWRNKKGPFKSLADILEVDGLGVKVLEKLCESIVSEEKNDPAMAINGKSMNNLKNRRQFLTPQLDSDAASALSSAVAFHLGPTSISWAKISREKNELEFWGFHDFSVYPKKMLPTDTFRLAMTILNIIPTAEAYIFEASPNISPQGNKQASVVSSYTQQLELTSMLLALINTSPNHKTFHEEAFANSVYHLRANLSARLFRTLMGTERVSSTSIVTNILEHARSNSICTLPCTPVSIAQDFQEKYYKQTPVFRELLGQALLLSITFMDLCVYKNPISLAAVAPGRRS